MRAPFLILVALGTSSFASAGERSVLVTGQCQRVVTPDRGAVTLVSEAKHQDLKTAERKATETYERVKAAVKKLGLAHEVLQTTEYNIGELREWENNRSVSKGFQARLGLRVETSDLKRLGEVTAVASKEGAGEISALQMFLSNAKQLQEHSACLKTAAENARAKAEELVKGVNAKVGATLELEEVGAETSPPMPMMKSAMAERMSSAPASIEGGQQAVNVSVRVRFELI